MWVGSVTFANLISGYYHLSIYRRIVICLCLTACELGHINKALLSLLLSMPYLIIRSGKLDGSGMKRNPLIHSDPLEIYLKI